MNLDMNSVVVSLSHIPTVHDNVVIDGCRIFIAFYASCMFIPMLFVARMTKNYGFYALGIAVFLFAIGEADQVGRPFIVYQLPLRALVLGIATYWLWKRRYNSRT